MKLALCAIGKCENNYIREWIEHYKQIGFDHIFLYDNNDLEGECFEEVIQDYIDSGFVSITNFRGKKICQMEAYNDCYSKHSEYDWIAFFDCDEFLQIENNFLLKGNVKRFLSQSIFKDQDIIKINWKTYTDSGILSPKGDYSIKKFTEFIEDRYHVDNRHVKCILKTNRNLKFIDSVHIAKGSDKICNVFGKKEIYSNLNKGQAIWVRAWINHYRLKTIEEFVLNKMQRLYPDHDDIYSKNLLNLDYFFGRNRNKYTPEKETYAKELLKQFE